MVSHVIIRRSGLFTTMDTIFCKGSRDLDLSADFDRVDKTIGHIHATPELLYSLSFLERLAVELWVERQTAYTEPERSENRARRMRLHNQYGHLAP
jgi:hypothetical protein